MSMTCCLLQINECHAAIPLCTFDKEPCCCPLSSVFIQKFRPQQKWSCWAVRHGCFSPGSNDFLFSYESTVLYEALVIHFSRPLPHAYTAQPRGAVRQVLLVLTGQLDYAEPNVLSDVDDTLSVSFEIDNLMRRIKWINTQTRRYFNKPFFFKSQQQVSLCVVNINEGKYKTGFLLTDGF